MVPKNDDLVTSILRPSFRVTSFLKSIYSTRGGAAWRARGSWATCWMKRRCLRGSDPAAGFTLFGQMFSPFFALNVLKHYSILVTSSFLSVYVSHVLPEVHVFESRPSISPCIRVNYFPKFIYFFAGWRARGSWATWWTKPRASCGSGPAGADGRFGCEM